MINAASSPCATGPALPPLASPAQHSISVASQALFLPRLVLAASVAVLLEGIVDGRAPHLFPTTGL